MLTSLSWQASQKAQAGLLSPLSSESSSSSEHSDEDPDWTGLDWTQLDDDNRHMRIGPLRAMCVLCGRGPFISLKGHLSQCPVKKGVLQCCHCMAHMPSEKDLLEHKVRRVAL